MREQKSGPPTHKYTKVNNNIVQQRRDIDGGSGRHANEQTMRGHDNPDFASPQNA